jgi:hypothetical protein
MENLNVELAKSKDYFDKMLCGTNFKTKIRATKGLNYTLSRGLAPTVNELAPLQDSK